MQLQTEGSSNKRMDFDCLGFGICAVDYLCLVPRYPGLDEKTEALEFSIQGGGPVATALTTLARLGRQTSFIGRVGDDDNGKFLVNEFNRVGVNISGLIIDSTVPTQQAFIWVDASNGKRSIVLNNSRYRPIVASELNLDYVRSAKYLLIDGRDTEATFALIHWAKAHGTKIVLDAGSQRQGMEELLALVDYPVVSEKFCRQYFGSGDYAWAVQQLFRRGATAAVVTCGSAGCYGADRHGSYYQPAFPVNVKDTTGAGDVFHGAFIFGLLEQWELKHVLKFASAVAALKCKQLGGRSGIPDLQTVNHFLNQFN